MRRSFKVSVFWDEEARMWVATSDDIVGLVTESRSLDVLYDRVLAVAPELLADNGVEAHHPQLLFVSDLAPAQGPCSC